MADPAKYYPHTDALTEYAMWSRPTNAVSSDQARPRTTLIIQLLHENGTTMLPDRVECLKPGETPKNTCSNLWRTPHRVECLRLGALPLKPMLWPQTSGEHPE